MAIVPTAELTASALDECARLERAVWALEGVETYDELNAATHAITGRIREVPGLVETLEPLLADSSEEMTTDGVLALDRLARRLGDRPWFRFVSNPGFEEAPQ